jgi:predicted enzyme related to lactoylglutathione lyase
MNLMSLLTENTMCFEPSSRDFKINCRVENLEELINQHQKSGVTITDTIETVEYRKFVPIMDIEGNKIELWEPNDIEFEKLGEKLGAKTTR